MTSDVITDVQLFHIIVDTQIHSLVRNHCPTQSSSITAPHPAAFNNEDNRNDDDDTLHAEAESKEAQSVVY